MPVTTLSSAIHITPVVIKTFIKHGKKKLKRIKNGQNEPLIPQDDIFFDQAFNIVKAFIDMGTKNTIESLQAFTNTHIPAPYWAAVSPVVVPLSSCNQAADHLIEWFGPRELEHVVGGERWWQVRGLDGIDAEWIAEQEDLDYSTDLSMHTDLNEDEKNILRMEKLESVMFYVHGGGYFWGSINTHRYQILRLSRKFKGRSFAVNYRKAPQYPWPCPLQDVLAAYLYLIQPPPGSLHKAIEPSKIVFAGDSAGGGLCVTVLTILRDLALPLPAGAALISPWVDLTHSFPSVMQNTETDIIPQHGFLAKPSTLWPVPCLPSDGGRVVPTVSNEPPKPGHADTLKPVSHRKEPMYEGDQYGPGVLVKSQQEMLDNCPNPHPHKPGETCDHCQDSASNGSTSLDPSVKAGTSEKEDAVSDRDLLEPKPPKVLMDNPNAVPLEVRSQIQMYAMTEQLTHPLVSPILQGSLANLPPLYIIAGDGEVLRDEIVYLAHRAAYPSEYPTREGVLRDGHRQKENAEKFTTPTKVHLQVFDGMCHVLTVFMFTKSAKYAYRSIAEFIRHLTTNNAPHLEKNPFPELHRPPSNAESGPDVDLMSKSDRKKLLKQHRSGSQFRHYRDHHKKDTHEDGNKVDAVDAALWERNRQELVEVEESKEAFPPSDNQGRSGSGQDIPLNHMICQRVDMFGEARQMEPRESIPCLQVKPSQFGIIKEAPVLRWSDGQAKWDKKYARLTKRVLRDQEHNTAEAERMIKNALDQGLILESEQSTVSKAEESSSPALGPRQSSSRKLVGHIQDDRRWGPLDLANERPPPTAIAGRRDTLEALALLKKSIYHTAPVTHRTVPTLKISDAIRAAFDPRDDPNRAPKQSVSEQQAKVINPIHGLKMWDDIITYFGRKTSAKATNGINSAINRISSQNENSQT